MRLATALVDGKSEFVLSPDLQSDWILWKEIQAARKTDKLVSGVHSLLDFVERSVFLLPWTLENKNFLNALPMKKIPDEAFLTPFKPRLFRDFYCFEEHVLAGRKSRGLEMIPEWYEAPIFYYSNPFSFRGPFERIQSPQLSCELDCELEIACIIGKEIRNASIAQAREAIFGYSVLNDWSARDLQRFEMKLNMGPMKGKDFATSWGHYIVTKDEIEILRTKKGYDIEFECRINDQLLTKKSWSTISFSFEEMLVRASADCTVYPGEVIASGTMGGGSLLEKVDRSSWLKEGDTVEMRWLPSGPRICNQVERKESLDTL